MTPTINVCSKPITTPPIDFTMNIYFPNVFCFWRNFLQFFYSSPALALLQIPTKSAFKAFGHAVNHQIAYFMEKHSTSKRSAFVTFCHFLIF